MGYTHITEMSAQVLSGQDWTEAGWAKKIPSTDGAAPIDVAKASAKSSSSKKFRELDNATDAVKIETSAPLELRQRIMQARTAKGMTQAKLAQAINLPQKDIAAFEAGKAMPNGQVINKMSRALGV